MDVRQDRRDKDTRRTGPADFKARRHRNLYLSH